MTTSGLQRGGGGAEPAQGFTLAEVLITLGIIGVVAVLTMPALVANYQEKATVVKLKKFYSVISQAYVQAIVEHGDIANWGIEGTHEDPASHAIVANKLMPYLKVTRECGALPENCMADLYLDLNGNISPGDVANAPNDQYYVNLADGSAVLFRMLNANCTGDGACGFICYDVNGRNLPNQRGLDFFCLYYTKTRVIPLGNAAATVPSQFPFTSYCNRTKTSTAGYPQGTGCAAWVIYNENMDYLHCDDLSWNGKHKCD